MKITFNSYRHLVTFTSMAEGMEEVKSDCGEIDMALALSNLVTIIAYLVDCAPCYPATVELMEAFREPAQSVLDNCIDNGINEADVVIERNGG